MSDLLQVADLEKAKLHDTFHSEVITGKAGGLAGGADINSATNGLTGQVQATLPKLLSQIGFAPADFDFTTGGTLTNRSQSIFYEADGNWYSWGGSLPKTIPTLSSPASTGGVTINAWNISTSAFMYRDYQGVKDELYSQAGIVDSGLPNQLGNSQFVDAMNKLISDGLNSQFVSLVTDIKSNNYSDFSQLMYGGDTILNANINSLWRRTSFDDPAKAGHDPEILGGTLFVWDSVGSAFVDIKESIRQRTRSEGVQSGRHVHIYKWGSSFGGNDWCFVRTPDNYTPHGPKHPLLILNHGNGWYMDGTIATANFSSKTQFGVDTQNGGTYLDTDRPDYVEYSSPLIEAFLAQGYIVCGAQNNGSPNTVEAGYGNRVTVQNIWFFYQHMIDNYNVESYCNMIAASNGAIATINAARQMGRDKIRSISLLYPLINLHAAWRSGNAGWESQLAAAYGFTSNPSSFSAFLDGTRSSDPFVAGCELGLRIDDIRYSNVEAAYANTKFYRLYDDVTDPANTKVKWLRENRLVDAAGVTDLLVPLDNLTFWRKVAFEYPRIRCVYSPDDTATPMTDHAVPFLSLLERGNKQHFGEQVLGGHGDYRHFEGLDGLGVSRLIAWTKL